MSHLDPVYACWPNAQALAEAIGAKGVTVRQWRNRGSVPSKHWQTIIAAAAERGHQIDWTQLAGMPE